MKLVIIKKSFMQFQICWQHRLDAKIQLDFNPLNNKFELTKLYKHFLLVHFQAKPKDLRQWGIYQFPEDNYTSVNIIDVENNDHDYLMTKENLDIQPNCTIFYPNAFSISTGNNSCIIKNVNFGRMGKRDNSGSGDDHFSGDLVHSRSLQEN